MAEIKNTFKYVWYVNMPVYGSRIRLRGDTDADYAKLGTGAVLYDYTKKNFNYNDGITTELTTTKYENNSYAIVTSEDAKDDDGNYVIESRWFVMESIKLRNGQYRLRLRRDVVADNYEMSLNSLAYIEKAPLDVDNKLIYNSEGNILNRIKKSETLLIDKTRCAWIVGYYAKNIDDKYLKGTVAINEAKNFEYENISTTIDNWALNQYSQSNPVRRVTKRIAKITSWLRTGPKAVNTQTMRIYDYDGIFESTIERKNIGDTIPTYKLATDRGTYGSDSALLSSVMEAFSKSDFESAVKTNFSINDDIYSQMVNYNGKIVRDTDGKFFRCVFIKGNEYSYEDDIDSTTQSTLFSFMDGVTRTAVNSSGETVFNSFPSSTNGSYWINIKCDTGYLQVSEIPSEEYIFDMTGTKAITEDSGYNIFAIPYPLDTDSSKRVMLMTDPVLPLTAKTLASYVMTKEKSLAIAQSIATTMGSNLYDIQLLPYCPMQEEVGYSSLLPMGLGIKTHIARDGSYAAKGITYSAVGKASESTTIDKDNLIGVILYAPSSRFSFPIYQTINMEGDITSAKDIKIANECDMYRLCSPNYQGNFEFSVAKNGGSVQSFNVDCAYKPYSPYIHIAPNFSEMYGQNFNDARGLTCAGDFSLDIVSDAWQQYQINNKNYENIFNRQIENMDFNYGQQRIQKAFSSITGTVQGGMSGAMAGGMSGGVYGAAAGAIIGTAASAIGAGVDWAMMESAYQEQKQYAYDNFNFKLGNIQALPYSLTKVSSFNPNSKIVPFLEYYSCTDKERTAIQRKIEYDGMSVGMIDYIKNYAGYSENIKQTKYVKATLVRPSEGFTGDEHLYQEIAKELAMGVYL